MTDIFILIKQHLEQQLPFVVYRKPDEKRLIGHFQKNDHLYFVNDFTEKGYVFAPFCGNPIIYFPESESETLTAGWFTQKESVVSSVENSDDCDGENFKNLVAKAVDTIKAGQFKKVVLSRMEDLKLPDFNVIRIFENILNTYTAAYAYCWFHPKIGLWMGASPEQLLRVDGQKFFTVSLAGTQKYKGSKNAVWQQKEQEEQLLVTDFILQNLREIASELIVSSPYTSRAGNLLHIKTDIEGKFKKGFSLKDAIPLLQPTPAVCGLPREQALEFINSNEGYDREYYTGYLGELNRKTNGNSIQTDLFVNLRCMKVKNNTASIFVGCGITKDSEPHQEYLETVAKSMTIKKIL